MSMSVLLWLGIGLLVGVVVGLVMGSNRGNKGARTQISLLLDSVRQGRLTDSGQVGTGGLPELSKLRAELEKGWAPRGIEGEDATRLALSRIAKYLRSRVEEPLEVGLDGGEAELRDGANDVLDAMEDLDFFLEDPPTAPPLETLNLVDLVGDVSREFGGQFTVRVRVDGPTEPLRIAADPETLKDALFLILHNAGDFGGGEVVDMTLAKEEDGTVRILIRDGGPGFSAEALLQAFDPFYTTSPGGLGLGLPYARKAVMAQGGEMALRNPEGGGAEVEIVLPPASG